MILDCMLGTSFGGLEQVFLDQLTMLPAAGTMVRGVAQRGSPSAQRAAEAGLPCDEITILSEWDAFSLHRARAVVRQNAPRLLLCHGRRAHQVFARAMGKRLPIVAMVHKPRFDRNLPHTGVIVVAEHRRRSLIADGVSEEKIVVVPNAVPLPPTPKQSYDTKPGAPIKIAGLGRLHEQKGFPVLIEALRILADRQVPFTCAIAGEGPSRDLLTRAISDRGLERDVTLPGWIDKPAGFLMDADIFAFPSVLEDFPLALLEAMSCGLPIVSSRIDGPKDFLVDGETALLVPADDPAAHANALERLSGDAALRERLGRNVRALVERNYGVDSIGRRLASALSNVAAGRPIGEGL